MKRKIVLICLCLVLVASLFAIIGCGKPEHTHELEKVDAIAATCSAEGQQVYWECKVCGKKFSDDKGESEIQSPAKIDKIAHTPGEEWVSDNEKHYHECTVCGEKLDEAAHTHQITVKAKNDFYLVGSTFSKSDISATGACSVCGKAWTAPDYSFTDITLAKDSDVKVTIGGKEYDIDVPVYDFDNYEFKAYDDYVVVVDGNINKEKGYVGFIDGKSTKITFPLLAIQDTKAALYISLGSAGNGSHFNHNFVLKVNGEVVSSNKPLPVGDEWESYTEAYVTLIDLGKGENTIILEYLGARNVHSITILAEEEVMWNHECESKCSICGKCKNPDCDHAVCEEKCTHVQNYKFVTYDGNAMVLNGNVKPNEKHVGWQNGNTTSITFEVYSQTATTARLYIELSSAGGGANFSDIFTLRINGTSYESNSALPIGGEWVTYFKTYIGTYNLVEGKNTIVLSYTDARNVHSLILHTEQAKWYAETLERQVFSAIDSKVKLTNASIENNNNIGKTKPGTEVYFEISSDKAGMAYFYFEISESEDTDFSNHFQLYINGVEVTSSARLPGAGGWFVYSEVYIGVYNLKQGKNEFKFVFKGARNIKNFAFRSECNLTWYTGE